MKHGSDAAALTRDEERLAEAVEATVTLEGSAYTKGGDAPRRWRRSIGPAVAAVVRSPIDLTVVALLSLVGAAYSPWVFAVAVGAALAMVAIKASRHRRAAVDSIGLRLYALRALAPDSDLAERVKELGALLVRAGMASREAYEWLAHYDRHALAEELHNRRSAAISAADGRRIDSLAQALDAVDTLTERRRALSREVRKVEAREDAIRSDLFKVRAGHLPREALASTLVSIEADVEDAVTALHQELAAARTLIRPVIPRRSHRRGIHTRFWPQADARPAAPANPGIERASRRWSEMFVGRERR